VAEDIHATTVVYRAVDAEELKDIQQSFIPEKT
jgi:hypothetical protein